MDHNPYPTSYDSFNYDPLSFDDDLHQLVNSIIPPTPQNFNVSAIFSESNLQSQDHTLLPNISSSIQASQQHQAITPHEQDNVAAATSSMGKGKKNLNSKDTERQRRHEMASLYHDLRSILPEEYVKGKRSKSDLVQEAINYISNLQVGIEELNEKKDKLSRMTKKRSAASRSSSTSNNNITQQNYNVTVKPCKEGFIEVIVNTTATYDDNDDENNNQSLPLSKVLHILNEEGLNIINCVSSRIDENMVHTIQAQIDDGREIDLGLLQQTLTYHY